MQETLTTTIVPLLLKAGDLLLSKWNTVSIHHYKKSEDICTNLDLEIETLILNELKTHFKDHAFDSEENGVSGNKDSDYVWLIDPIDGSKNYIAHLPFFCISIALMYKGETIFGAIYSPKTEELFYATKNEGAFLLNQIHGEDFEMESVVKIAPSQKKELKKAQVHVELPTDTTSKKTAQIFKKIHEHSYRVRNIGSGAIAVCYTAMGGYEAYVDLSSTTKACDLAAALLIAKEAGLKVLDIEGNDFSDPETQHAVVASTHIIKQIISLS